MKQPKRFLLAANFLAFASIATNAFAATDPAKAKVFDAVIVPVLSAKSYDCHGADKDKSKLRLHTRESLLKGGKDAGGRFIDALQMILRLVNIGDATSLACHPATTTHRQLSEEQLDGAGAGANVVRLSVGIEFTF